MKKAINRPKWWLLYAGAAVVLGVMWIEAKEPFSQANHTWIEAGLVIVLFGLTFAWLNANEVAILSAECERGLQSIAGEPEEASQARQAVKAGGNGNNRDDLEVPAERQPMPGWAIALAGIILALFKTQDR